jgi:hypothetical protein
LAIAMIASVTVIAPPMRVAVWAKGISGIRCAVSRTAPSPAPPLLQQQEVAIAKSIGNILRQQATANQVAVIAATVATIVNRLAGAPAAFRLSHGVIAKLFVKIAQASRTFTAQNSLRCRL